MGTTRGMANGSEVGTMWGADGRQRHVGTKVEPEAKWEPCGDHGEPSGWGGGKRGRVATGLPPGPHLVPTKLPPD